MYRPEIITDDAFTEHAGGLWLLFLQMALEAPLVFPSAWRASARLFSTSQQDINTNVSAFAEKAVRCLT